MDENTKFWLCAVLAGLGPSGARKLIDRYGSIKNVFSLSVKELRDSGIPLKTAENIARWKQLPWEEEIKFCKENNISLISIDDNLYPRLLREIHNPPLLLYVKGTLPSDSDICVAIVGTRNPSLYGIRIAEKFAEKLSLYGITVVSGMARGIDTAAHKGALKGGGRTVAITGCGFRYCYPAENRLLLEEIAKKGAVATEFPSFIKPKPENFPRRNRIVSGMCKGVLVVEAGQKSGALITADLALEQGREVFAIPGRADDLTSKGTNYLLKEGAILVEEVEDIIEALNLEIKSPEKKKEESSDLLLTETEKIILEHIPSGKQINIDELSINTGIKHSLLFQSLVSLIAKGFVVELPGKFYTRK